MNSVKTLKELSKIPGVSGFEKELAHYVAGLMKGLCDSVEVDRFHNVIGIKKGLAVEGKKIMITAHLDEIGLIVTGIDEKGFVSFSNVGGVDARILPAQEVVIHGVEDIEGIIGAKPPHILSDEERRKAVRMKDMRIDTGRCADELQKLIRIGDVITFKAVPLELANQKLASKTMDNRSSVAALMGILEELKRVRHADDVYVVATVQEEFRLAGAITAAYRFGPDLAIVIDACHGDTPDAPREETYSLGKGPAIGVGPILDRELSRKLIETAKEENLPYQIDVEAGSTGTEAWATQVSRSGIPTALISIPVRYMHTPVETVHMEDIKNASRLAARFVMKEGNH